MINVHHTRHQLDLDRPVSACLVVSLPVFQVTFVHSVYNLALFLPSCCCSCLLRVAANSIWIFLVSRQNFFFCGQKECIWLFFWKISSQLMAIVFYPFS